MKHPRLAIISILTISLIHLCSTVNASEELPPITWQEATTWPYPGDYERIHYAAESPLQFGDLRLPDGPGPHPVAIMIHGGGWKGHIDIDHFGKAAKGLTDAGIATWSLEYRRIGNKGGGWPGTFQDIAHGTDHLRELAEKYPIDLDRVIAIGHSAGGHFALWLASRSKLKETDELYIANPLKIKGVLGLAAVPDLKFRYSDMCKTPDNCDDTIQKLMGGTPEQYPARYQQGSPIENLPLNIPQILFYGGRDEWTRTHFYHEARAAGDDVRLINAPSSGHFEMIDPDSPQTWHLVNDAAHDLINLPSNRHIDDITTGELLMDRMVKTFITARNNRDANGMISIYANDAVYLPSGKPPIVGKEAIAEIMSDYAAVPGNRSELSITNGRTYVDGNLIVQWGTSTSTKNNSDGTKTIHQGKHIFVGRKTESGDMELILDIDNSNH